MTTKSQSSEDNENSLPESSRHALFPVLLLGLLCLGLPPLGGWLLGMSWQDFWSLPLIPKDMGYDTFSLPLNIVFWLVFVALVTWWWRGHRKAAPAAAEPTPARVRFPWWGWLAGVSLLAFWLLAWTRFPWFEKFQAHTFTPIWVSFIVLLNALVQARSGTCPLREYPIRFLALFPLSAVFWWVFEYYNRFVHNWLYHGVEDWSPGAYALHATLAFSTVLPAACAMERLLRTFPRLQSFFTRGPTLPRWLTGKPAAAFILALTCTGFFLIGKLPEVFFPLLWGGPVLTWICLNTLLSTPLDMGGVSRGNWRWALTWAFAGLACGFCWELWNFYSLAKWTYQIPWFETLYIFEMPLAGYTGYLPFGLECGLVIMAVWGRQKT